MEFGPWRVSGQRAPLGATVLNGAFALPDGSRLNGIIAGRPAPTALSGQRRWLRAAAPLHAGGVAVRQGPRTVEAGVAARRGQERIWRAGWAGGLFVLGMVAGAVPVQGASPRALRDPAPVQILPVESPGEADGAAGHAGQCAVLGRLALAARALAQSGADRRVAAEVLGRMLPADSGAGAWAASPRLAARMLELAYRDTGWPQGFARQFETACLSAGRSAAPRTPLVVPRTAQRIAM